jgi:nucleolar complex protein 2
MSLHPLRSQTRSLRSLRRLLLAFRAAAHSNSDSSSGPSSQQSFAYTIESPAVFNKLLLTTLKFTPLVLAHHLPFRVSPTTGRYKMTKSAPPALMKMVLSYMANLMHLIGQLPDEREGGNLIRTVLVESGKMVPWILGARKTVRGYLKVRREKPSFLPSFR